MTITLPPDLADALKQYSQDNGISVDQAATEMIAFFLQPVKDKLS